MDYKLFLEMVEEELEFLEPFDISRDEPMLLGAAALVQLRSYIPLRMEMDRQFEEELAMQQCLDAAWESQDPDAKALQHRLFGDVKPTLEEFIQRLAELATDSLSAE